MSTKTPATKAAQLLERIQRNYERLEEELSELEAKLPEPTQRSAKTPRKPR